MKELDNENANSATGAVAFSIARSLAVCFLLLFVANIPVSALNPDKHITQYGHASWRTQDGYLTRPAGIAQTTDGYIWIGTIEGLMRFDGVKFTVWTPPEGQSLPTKGFSYLLGARDGSLWIGTTGGLSQLKNGQLINYVSPQLSSSGIGAIIEDETGTIWFTRYLVSDGKGPLCRIKDGELRCYGKEDGIPVNYGLGLAKDRAGNIWFGSEMLCRWSPQSSAFFFNEKLKSSSWGDGVIDVAVGPSETVWAAIDGTGPNLGVRYFSGGKWSSYKIPGFDGASVLSHTLYLDRNDSLWVGAQSKGLYRIHNGTADYYGTENGLSDKNISHMYEDREGNLWVITDNGVDMFRDTPVVSFSESESILPDSINSVLALRDNSVLVGSLGGVKILRPPPAAAADNALSFAPIKDLPGKNAAVLLEDRRGRVWMAVDEKLVIYKDNQFSEVKKSDGSLSRYPQVRAMTEDSGGNIWALILKDKKLQLQRIINQRAEEDIPLNDFIPRAVYLAADKQGSLWIASTKDKLARYHNGQIESVSLGDEGSVTINSLSIDSDNALLISTNKGLYRWINGSLSLMDARNGLPCSSVADMLQDDDANLWLYARCGLLRIPAADMANWRQNPESKVSVKTFDSTDGVRPSPTNLSQPRSAKAPDGRLWFVNESAAVMIDPKQISTNSIPPPIYIEGLVADRKSYQTERQIDLPPLQGELEINYTGLSFPAPRKVKFRYKLEGHDADWQDVGTRRQAFYNNLGPGKYRFQVIASNNDGIWNETGATLDFIIEPTWYQTTAFRVLCLLFVGLIGWGLYQLRIRQISKVISARFDERLAERTRLARELHDTFLQTVQGSKLVADDALEQPEDLPHMRRAMTQLSVWLGQATEEGRAALNSLRTTTTEKNDLAEAFRRATESCRLRESAAASFSVVGDSREMHPIVRDEIYRIGYEAIRNACQHSKASRLEVELRYAQDLSVCVKDNGVGIDPVVAAQGKDGHFGLQGMRERAARIGAKLSIASSAVSGTEIKLVVPGGIVFRKAADNLLET